MASELPDRICIWDADNDDPNSARGWTVSFPENHPNVYVRAATLTRPAPAATDTGLVTVAWLQPLPVCNQYGWLDAMAWQEGEFSSPVVTRLQAEELLAAERANTETALEQRNMTIAELGRLEADNAAQDARIKELEAALDGDPSGSDLWRYWSRKACEASQKYVDEVDRAEALEAKLTAAKDLISRAQEIIPGNYMHWHDFARAVLGGKP